MRVKKSVDEMLEEVGFGFSDIRNSHYELLRPDDVVGSLLAIEASLRKTYPQLSHLTGSVVDLLDRALWENTAGQDDCTASLKIFGGEHGYLLRIRAGQPVYGSLGPLPGVSTSPLVRKGLQYSVDDDGCGLNLLKLYGRSALGARVRRAAPEIDADRPVNIRSYAADEWWHGADERYTYPG